MKPPWSLLLWAPAQDGNGERFWSLSKYWLDLIKQEEPQWAIAVAAAPHWLWVLSSSAWHPLSCPFCKVRVVLALGTLHYQESSTVSPWTDSAAHEQLVKANAVWNWGGGCRIKCRLAWSDSGSVAAKKRAEIWKYQLSSPFPHFEKHSPSCWHQGPAFIVASVLFHVWGSRQDTRKIINPKHLEFGFWNAQEGQDL